MKRLVVIDEYFARMTGHYYEYNKSVQQIFAARGVDVKIYANRSLDRKIADELGAEPSLPGLQRNSLNKIPVLGSLINRLLFWRRLYRSLIALYRAEAAPDTVFFFTTVVWFNVLPVVLAALRSGRTSVLLYRLSVTEHPHPGLPAALNSMGDWLYRYTFRKAAGHSHIRFCTDSDVIADECNRLFHCGMITLPIPHIQATELPVQSPKSGAKLTVHAPGAIRTEKGIDFIAAAFAHMAATGNPVLQRIRLVTQYSASGDTHLNQRIQHSLRAVPVEQEMLGDLSTQAYNDQLLADDIVLIPYSIEHGYRARTSGIMSETIAACKPFITTAGSWMSLQGEKYNTGMAIPYGDVEAFAQALSEVVDHYQAYATRAIAARSGWLAYHSKENFYHLFMSMVDKK